jgi:gamma-glutamyl:cysteine ligase YbdK (ATP-grasp superfamily)
MGDTQKLTPDEQIRSAFEAYEAGTDFTVAVEEEFAILDPETLELSNRFEELQQAAQGTPLESHLVGELIASEVEVRTGRCESFADAASKMAERRSQLHELALSLGASLALRTIRGPLARPAHHRHAPLPQERRDPPLRRLA